MASQKNQTTQDAAAFVDNLGRLTFWAERMITIALTPLWIHSCYYILVYLKEPKTFEIVASFCAIIFLVTSGIHLFCGTYRSYIDLLIPRQDLQVLARKEEDPLESQAFVIERAGMLLVLITSLPLGYGCNLKFSFCVGPCVILFPIANFFYLTCFIFEKNGDLAEKFSPSYSSFKDRFIKFKNSLEEVLLDCDLARYYRKEKGEEKDDQKAMDKEKLNGNAMEKKGSEMGSDERRESDGIPDLEEIKEAEEDELEEAGPGIVEVTDKCFSEESFEIVHGQNDHDQIRGAETLEREKEIASAKEDYQKKLKKVVKKWEKKEKKLRENYEEDRQKWDEERRRWKGEKHEFVSRLSASAAQTEIYRLQALEKEENCRRLEDEKTDLITKLCAANSSLELYRNILHDIHN